MSAADRSWFACVLVATVLGLQALTSFDPAIHQQLVKSFGLSGPDLMRLEVYRLVLSPLIQTRPGFVGTVWVTLLIVSPLAAWRLGPCRSAAIFFISDWAGSLSVLLPLGAAALLGDDTARGHWIARDVGSSSGTYALLLGVALTLPRVWAVVATVAFVAVFGSRVLLVGRVYDYQHAISLAAALGIMRLIPTAGARGLRSRTRFSH